MRYAYAAVLRLYPVWYRDEFGQEMLSVFRQAAGDFKTRGFLAYTAFLGTEIAGLTASAFSMRTGDLALRSRRRLSARFVLALFAGIAMAALTQACFLTQIAHLGQHDFLHGRAQVTPPPVPDLGALLALIGSVLFLVCLFSMAFVWNLRNMRRRNP